jgi:hypothetical protein
MATSANLKTTAGWVICNCFAIILLWCLGGGIDLLVTHQVVRSLRFSGTSVPRDYEEQFQRAVWTFRHQRVFCPQRHTLLHLRDIPASGLWLSGQQLDGSLDFLGPNLPDDIAKAIAVGESESRHLQPVPQHYHLLHSALRSAIRIHQ